MIYHWQGLNSEITGIEYHHEKALDLQIRDGEYQFDRTYTGKTTPTKTLYHKHIEIIKVSDKRACDTSLEKY